jgi:hypothetical protein
MSRRWYKGADPVFLNGMLVPGKPEKYMVDDKEKIRWVTDLEGLVSERAAA